MDSMGHLWLAIHLFRVSCCLCRCLDLGLYSNQEEASCPYFVCDKHLVRS